MKPTLLFYGNCQADALSALFSSDPIIKAAYDVRHIANFDDRVQGANRTGIDAVRSAAVFFDQHDRTPFPHLDALPDRCTRISFPSVDLNLLWPLDCVNLYNDKPTPEMPWGRFPYGDRAIVDGVKNGLGAAELIAAYDERSRAALPNLGRFEQLEVARLRARDEKCDVKFAEYVVANFRAKELFFCVNHLTLSTLRVLSQRLIEAAAESAPALAAADMNATISAWATIDPEGPLGLIRVPVHPAVADQLGLAWCPPPDVPYYGLNGRRVRYRTYIDEMIECGVAARDQVAIESPLP